MPETSFLVLLLVIIIALVFDYINGFNDSANAIATCVSTRALSISSAVIMAAVLNFIGAMISTKVASTIGQGIVEPNDITQVVVLAGIGGAIIWSLITWYFAIPSSSTHALIGGLIGSSVAHVGFSSLHWVGIKAILLSLLLSPIVGIVISFWLMILLLWISRNFMPDKLNKNFRKLQVVSAAFVAFSHGTADAQKSMGVITMALVSYGAIETFYVPWLVVISCAIAMALGTAIGGWRIIKTVGKDFVKLQPIHGFCVQTSTAGVVLAASAFGLPTSTTHIITSSILGVGLTKRLSAINWKIAQNILLAWVLTIPASSIVAFLLYAMIHAILTKIFS
ncbi:MAG: inorganic phosphate transporter [Gammaproteobacteria bacterium]|nr:inorganic phosphate transporter [Gammaproteobacteria bacterium]